MNGVNSVNVLREVNAVNGPCPYVVRIIKYDTFKNIDIDSLIFSPAFERLHGYFDFQCLNSMRVSMVIRLLDDAIFNLTLQYKKEYVVIDYSDVEEHDLWYLRDIHLIGAYRYVLQRLKKNLQEIGRYKDVVIILRTDIPLRVYSPPLEQGEKKIRRILKSIKERSELARLNDPGEMGERTEMNVVDLVNEKTEVIEYTDLMDQVDEPDDIKLYTLNFDDNDTEYSEECEQEECHENSIIIEP